MTVQECSRCAKPLADNEVHYFGTVVVCNELKDCVTRQRSIHEATGGIWSSKTRKRTKKCSKCGKRKEPTRPFSKLCRSCDHKKKAMNAR